MQRAKALDAPPFVAACIEVKMVRNARNANEPGAVWLRDQITALVDAPDFPR